MPALSPGVTPRGVPSAPHQVPIGVPVGGGASPVIVPVSSNATAMQTLSAGSFEWRWRRSCRARSDRSASRRHRSSGCRTATPTPLRGVDLALPLYVTVTFTEPAVTFVAERRRVQRAAVAPRGGQHGGKRDGEDIHHVSVSFISRNFLGETECGRHVHGLPAAAAARTASGGIPAARRGGGGEGTPDTEGVVEVDADVASAADRACRNATAWKLVVSATTRMPAACAAAMPIGASSKTRQSAG